MFDHQSYLILLYLFIMIAQGGGNWFHKIFG